MRAFAIGLALLLASGQAHAASCGTGLKLCDCGDTVVGTYTLSNSDPVVSTGTGDTCSTDIGLHLASGAVLNGAGKTIRGAVTAPANLDAAGVIFDACGASVNSVIVEGFHNGVTLQSLHCTEATHPHVQNVSARQNGDANGHAGYGIKINDSQWALIEGVSISGAADEGVHIGGGSSNVTMQAWASGCGPVVNTIKDSYRENLYFRSSSNNQVSDLQSSYPAGPCGSVSSCVAAYIKSSSSNTISASTLSDYRLVLTGDANNNAIGLAGSGQGVTLKRIEIEASNEGSPDGNVFTNVTANSGTNSCVAFTQDTGSINTTPPAGNMAVSGSLANCVTEVNVSAALTGTLSSINNLCGFTCADGSCSQNDPFNIVKFGSECP